MLRRDCSQWLLIVSLMVIVFSIFLKIGTFAEALSIATIDKQFAHTEIESARAHENKDQTKVQKKKPSEGVYLELHGPRGEGPGMFTMLVLILGMLQEYEKGDYKGCRVDFKDYGNYYDPQHGYNWWEYYFESINIGDSKDCKTKKFTLNDYGTFLRNIEYRSSREAVYYLISQYIRPKAHILVKVEDFQKKYFENTFIIGVHYRGTDKKIEAPRVQYEKVLDRIKSEIDKRELEEFKIYIATDEQSFLDYLKEEFPERILFLQDIQRSNTDQPLHFNNANIYQHGEEALLDCLLLSKCNLLIRTSSNLSLCSTFFNPYLEVIPLSQRLRKY